WYAASTTATPDLVRGHSLDVRLFQGQTSDHKECVMKLYCFPPSPNTWKVRATAHQIGVPLELEIVDLTKGAQRKPEYLALNPTGRTPTLVDDGLTLWESSAIMQYLGDKQKTPLWPNDSKARADIMRWQSWHLQHWGAAVTPFIFENM